MPDEQISLRPRLSIFKDIHPELYDLFNRIPPTRHNSLVMQMLVRMATIERYGGIGAFSAVQEDIYKAGSRLSPEPVSSYDATRPTLSPSPAPEPVLVHTASSVPKKSIDSASQTDDAQKPGTSDDRKDALGGMLD